MMHLDDNALNLISIFRSHSYAAYAVGGCVRDSIMGVPCNDTDIAVACTPDVTVDILAKSGIRYVKTGIKHGTVTAIVDSTPYEITTFRTDGDYTDSRHPDSVSFVARVEDDLARRDFTVNAMAYSPDSGIIDLFGGRADIENKIIRTVGEPDLRFSEDALRILRALRFSSTLGFCVEQKTAQSILDNCDSLASVARERITAELEKLLVGVNATSVLTRFYPLFCKILDVDGFSPSAVGVLPPDFALRLAAISDGHTLVLSGAVRHRVDTVRNNRDVAIDADTASVRRALAVYGVADTRDILLSRGDTAALSVVRQVVRDRLPYSISHLDVNGSDLVALGFRGARIGEALNTLLFAVIDGKVSNVNKKLLDYIANL